jgi:hypothetical protein
VEQDLERDAYHDFLPLVLEDERVILPVDLVRADRLARGKAPAADSWGCIVAAKLETAANVSRDMHSM